MSDPITSLTVRVYGRPAPQGSKHHGQHGQMREASAYLPAWRAVVKRSIYEEYKRRSILPQTLPLFRGPVSFVGTFLLLEQWGRVDGPPDLDKLLRAVFDACQQARLVENDSRFVRCHATKVSVQADPGMTLTVGLLV
jgi:hypothetical protein